MKNVITKATRRKINRSGKQTCIICGEISILVSHHINGRNIEYANKWWNLAEVCDNCHKKIHSNVLVVEKWASTTNGRELLWHYAGDESITGEEAKPYLIPQN